MCNCNVEKLIKKSFERIDISAIAFEDGIAVITLEGKGVKPLFDFVEKNKESLEKLHGLYWGDKVVGKASAMLFLFLKPKYIYGEIVSEKAVKVLEENGIEFSFGKKVAFIENRDKTGMCPFEQAVLDQNSKDEAFAKIRSTLESFAKTKQK